MLDLNELKISRDKILSLDINKISDIEKEKYRKELKKNKWININFRVKF